MNKADLTEASQQTKYVEEKFFTSHRSSNPAEKTIVEFMKRKNDKEHFVEQTVKQMDIFNNGIGISYCWNCWITSNNSIADAIMLSGGWTSILLQIKGQVNHKCSKLIFLCANTALPSDSSNGFTRFVRSVV